MVTPPEEMSAPAGKILVYIPGVLLVTLIVIIQVLPPVTVALFSIILLPPTEPIVSVPLPQFESEDTKGVVITTLVGSTSCNPTLVSVAAPDGLAMLICNCDTWFTNIELGLKVLLKVTGVTNSVAEAARAFVTPWLELSAPAASVFVYVPAVLLVTLT